MVCFYKFTKAKSYFNNILVVVMRNGCGLLGLQTLKYAVLQEPIDEMSWFFVCWYKFKKAKSYYNIYWLSMVKREEALEIMGVLNQLYLTNDLMKWTHQLNGFCVMREIDIHWSYQNLLIWADIVWHRLPVNQTVRYFKLKKLKN